MAMTTGADGPQLDGDAVVQAARELVGRVWRTPTIRCPDLDEVAGAQLWLKAENLQRVGAFKARGALLAVGRLPPDQRARGIITYSSGNHAQAVALAARTFETRAWIAMPIDAPQVKVEAVRRLGAQVVEAGTTSTERQEVAQQLHREHGAPIIEPFDDPDIIAGQGTATLELLEDVAAAGSALDALLVPVGGGGLIAGACLACEGHDVAIYSVEPYGCDAMAQSLAQGRRVSVSPGPTLGDGLKPVQVGQLNFAIARQAIRAALHVDDEEMGAALVRLLTRAKLMVEPSGAAALAAALRGGLPGAPRRIGVILSGGNVAPELVRDLLKRHRTLA